MKIIGRNKQKHSADREADVFVEAHSKPEVSANAVVYVPQSHQGQPDHYYQPAVQGQVTALPPNMVPAYQYQGHMQPMMMMPPTQQMVMMVPQQHQYPTNPAPYAPQYMHQMAYPPGHQQPQMYYPNTGMPQPGMVYQASGAQPCAPPPATMATHQPGNFSAALDSPVQNVSDPLAEKREEAPPSAVESSSNTNIAATSAPVTTTPAKKPSMSNPITSSLNMMNTASSNLKKISGQQKQFVSNWQAFQKNLSLCISGVQSVMKACQ